MNVLAEKLSETQYNQFYGTTCFAQLSSNRRCHVQAQLIRCMFLREIEDNENDFVFNTEEPNMIILQYFDVRKAITKKQLVDNFSNKVWGDNDDDVVKFAILFYIHSFILSEEPTTTIIDRKDF
ncbi:hypothetical protein H5410_041572 [Solanum commersonii]|uniref:Uncharacterized protein n=1 Tax=Solanum commersonii TaxID=4109 RepID=A0A9J5XTH0_SOLCO|nr:hypothetical protein H5410_041572 [Solanum commersonii]